MPACAARPLTHSPRRPARARSADGKGTYWYLPPGQGLDGKKRPLLPAYTDKSFSYYIYRSGDDFDKVRAGLQ